MNTTPCKDLHALVNFHSITFDLFLTIQKFARHLRSTLRFHFRNADQCKLITVKHQENQ